MYVVRSRIGNSPRHFRSSSTGRFSTGRYAGISSTPPKVAHRKDCEPGDPGEKGDAKAVDPPGREHDGQNGNHSGKGCPGTGGPQLQVGFGMAMVVATECQVSQ